MQIHLADFIRETPEGKEAKALLRKCVRCGFCIATCPTYQLLRNDHDSPRGRIDIVKQVLEGSSVTAEMRLHLDRCLLCRLCETTCPSGVQFGRLLAIARGIVQTRAERPVFERLKRKALRVVIPRPALFNALVGLAQLFEPFLPASWKLRLPTRRTMARPWPQGKHGRRMLLVEGCVQPALSPATNPSAARVLDRLGITLVRALNGGCCGAVSLHLDAPEEARELARCNIDAWWPHVEQGIEAIITTTSACSAIIKDYGYLLARDAAYSDKARRVAELARDISEVVVLEKNHLLPLANRLPRAANSRKVAFHAPCTLQHGLKLKEGTETLLVDFGLEVVPVAGAHLCCGAAGTYSLLQPELSQRLLGNKIQALTASKPSAILTANIGCQCHLQGATALPVRHWIEAIDDLLREQS